MKLAVIGMLALSVMPISAWADTDIYFSGTVTAPMPCTINGKQRIETNFGNDMITTLVDGNHYLKEVNYNLECVGQSSNALRLKVQGNVADFNQSALQTNMSDLGIELRAGNKPLAINTWFNFNYFDKPVLQAVPVKRTNSNLPAGTFSVNATLLVDYQ
ncbi:fimbrial protein [Serratia ureilytica]|uniref:fimbrial protein n=1 Tax=Serratia ureilytica TaxID=300181 RepID=UPI00313D5F3E